MLGEIGKLLKGIRRAERKIRKIQREHKHTWRKDVPQTPGAKFERSCTGCLYTEEVSKSRCCPKCFGKMKYEETREDLPNGQEVEMYRCTSCLYFYEHRTPI